MTETSFPIVGQDLTNTAWAQAVGANSNGVLDDWGNPYAMVVNTNDTVTIRPSTRSGVARAVVNGFGHQIDADVTLTVPAVTVTTTYQLGLLYDPANASQPVKLVVLKGDPPVLDGGKAMLPLYIFRRASGQTLSAAVRYSPRPRIRPTLFLSSEDDLLKTNPLFFLYGTEAVLPGVSYTAQGTLTSPQWVMGPRTSSGTFSGTVRDGGATRVAHGLKTVPTAVHMTVMNHPSLDGNSRLFRPVLWSVPDAETFGVRLVDERNNAWAASQQIRFMWTAVYDGK